MATEFKAQTEHVSAMLANEDCKDD